MERAPEIFLRSSSCLSIAVENWLKLLAFSLVNITSKSCSALQGHALEMATKSVLEMFCICSFFLPLKQHSNVESVNDSQMQITRLQHKEEHFVCPQNKERKITILMIFVYS